MRKWAATALAVVVVALPASSPGAVGPSRPAQQRPPSVVVVTKDGFHWVDAGLGAAAALAVMLVAAGLALSLGPASGTGSFFFERRKR